HPVGNSVADALQRADAASIEFRERAYRHLEDAPVAGHPKVVFTVFQDLVDGILEQPIAGGVRTKCFPNMACEPALGPKPDRPVSILMHRVNRVVGQPILGLEDRELPMVIAAQALGGANPKPTVTVLADHANGIARQAVSNGMA